MITTIKLINTSISSQSYHFLCVCGEDTEEYSQKISSMQYNITNYSHHSVHYIPPAYSSYSWVPFDQCLPISPLQLLAIGILLSTSTKSKVLMFPPIPILQGPQGCSMENSDS